jgi:hypothetical protein
VPEWQRELNREGAATYFYIVAQRGLRGEDLNLRPSGYEAKIGPLRSASQEYEIIHNH